MKKLLFCVLIVFSLCFSLDGENEYYGECGRTVFDRIITLSAAKHTFKTITIDWSDFIGSRNLSPDNYILAGKIYVFSSGAMTRGITCMLLTPEQYEVYLSGEEVKSPLFKATKQHDISIRTLELNLGQKYYLILDNSHTKMTDKNVLLYLLALPKWHGG
ncbi:hypothetical protein A2Y85_05035 [candidate division WOR-3 bacterium RBG_13_43_14]|uniref:Uncharacterized protein n=1 Tax=candidate division WOR-3 bacterium RBG_13_43_14 TaxID=1802590 RepID=A0A1F4UEH4_UNCW3|nr:MAG: hypothetical protein A2Y85_05035 [candidate division WOR-3 bacterium RBG_13_43_14]